MQAGLQQNYELRTTVGKDHMYMYGQDTVRISPLLFHLMPAVRLGSCIISEKRRRAWFAVQKFCCWLTPRSSSLLRQGSILNITATKFKADFFELCACVCVDRGVQELANTANLMCSLF